MVVVNGKVFIHLFKCAGTTLLSVLLGKKRWTVKHIEPHGSLYNLPEKFNSYKKYALVRNPLTWYSSFYTFFIENKGSHSALEDVDLSKYVGMTIDEFITKAVNIDFFRKISILYFG